MPEQLYKDGYVEQELRKLAGAPFEAMHSSDLRHAIGMMSAAMLMILDRLPAKKSAQKRGVAGTEKEK